jgi:hypothetical protein
MTTKTEFIADPDSDRTIIAHTENFDGLIDHNKALQNEGHHGTKDMKHVANIPGIVIEQYCFMRGVSWAEFWADNKHIKTILNDPDMAYFRVAPGKV